MAERHASLSSVAAASATACHAAEQRHRAEAARADARQAADREVARLAALAPAVAQLAARQHAVAQLATATAGAAGRRDALERELAEARASRARALERAQALELAEVALRERERELERRRTELRLVRELRELERTATALAELVRTQAEALAAATAELARLEVLWLEGHASLLAVHLHDGQPCPVCGGTDHPAKARESSTLPGKEELQSAKERVRQIEQKLSDTKALLSNTNQTSAAKREEDKQYINSREDSTTNEDYGQRETRLTTEGIRLKEEADLLTQQVAELGLIKEQLVQWEVALDSLMLEKEKLTSSYQDLLVQFTEKQSELNADLARIPEEERSPEQVQQRLASQQQLANELNSSWNFAQEQLMKLTTQLGKDQAALTECDHQLAESNQRRSQAAERFTQQLAEAGFVSLDAYQAAQLSDEVYRTLQIECDSYDASRAALTKLVADLKRELTGQSPPDLGLITNQLADAKTHLDQVNDVLRYAEGRLQEVGRISQSLASLQDRSRRLDSQLSQLLDVYQTLKGDNPLKMSFERFILIEFLEHILQAANARLRRMSGGQFVLERSDRLEGKGRQSGLGLDVYDAYTGQTRDVKTLSGGEKFNASLCLALGMTDVIQSHQGGVSIEMMFIDEGFGTLDEDALNQAIETLVDLQRAGRMIGVISHVQELKNAFPAVLQVNKSKDGYSSTTFLLK
jgi:exonuclease SbcC